MSWIVNDRKTRELKKKSTTVAIYLFILIGDCPGHEENAHKL